MAENPERPAPVGVPGLVCVDGWLAAEGCAELLARIDEQPWSAQLRRRVQHYGHRYDYGRRGLAAGPAAEPAPPLPDWALGLAARLLDEGLMDGPAGQVIVNEYQPGQGISAHVDCVPCFGPVVAALSLGSAAVMDFTDPAGGGRVPVPLTPGGVTVLTGPARYVWRHAIAARRSDPGPAGRVPRGRRVSVTFRTLAGRPT